MLRAKRGQFEQQRCGERQRAAHQANERRLGFLELRSELSSGSIASLHRDRFDGGDVAREMIQRACQGRPRRMASPYSTWRSVTAGSSARRRRLHVAHTGRERAEPIARAVHRASSGTSRSATLVQTRSTRRPSAVA